MSKDPDRRRGVVVKGPMFGTAPLHIDVAHNPIVGDFNTRFFSFGSCFAQHATLALQELGFQAFFDPRVAFHYSPRTLRVLMERWAEGRPYDESELYRFRDTGRVTSPYHHSLTRSGPDAGPSLITEMGSRDAAALGRLRDSNIVLLTLGNATFLQLRDPPRTLCYGAGIPRGDYQILAMSVREIVDDLERIFTALRTVCAPSFSLIMTVSPQRYAWHLGHDDVGATPGFVPPEKDSVVYSNLDKAKLRVAIDEFQRAHPDGQVRYFPAFDIVLDELRLQESFAASPSDHLHVTFPHTPNYVVNRFLLSHCSDAMLASLQLHREVREKLPRFAESGDVPGVRDKLIQLLTQLGAHHSRLPNPVLMQEVLETIAANDLLDLAREHLGPEIVAQHDDSTIARALERLQVRLHAWISQRTRLALFGAGRHTQMLLRDTSLARANVVGIVDGGAKAPSEFFGIPVVPPERLPELKAEVVLISSVRFQEQMLRQARQLCTSGELVRVYEPAELEQALRAAPIHETAVSNRNSESIVRV